MRIAFLASAKGKDEFFEEYGKNPVDVNSVFDGIPLINSTLANPNAEDRYIMSMFLLERGATANVCNQQKEGPLHILFSHTEHDFSKSMILFRTLLEHGADVDQIDRKNRIALHYLVSMPGTDEEIMPFLELYLAQKPNINIRNKWGYSPLELAERFPYRRRFAERLREYAIVQ